MTAVRGHQPLQLGPFKGLWQRGDPSNTPLEYFSDSQNITPLGDDWTTRPGVTISQDVDVPLTNIKRLYNYPTTTGNDLIILTNTDDGTSGSIYHFVMATKVLYGPLLTITGMTDFAFIPYAGRAYISPFGTFDTGDINIQKGLQNEFLYVYLGDGTAARKAAGVGPTDTPLTIANGAAGHTDAGIHLFGTVFEYNTGYFSPIKQITQFTTSANNSVSFSGIGSSGDTSIVRVHLVATAKIDSYDGNTTGYQFFFIPDGSVPNGTTVLNNLSFFDQDLIDDASYLLDNFTEIPAGASLSIYHNRLVLTTTYTDISVLWISAEGEPEAINQINGLLIVPPDGNPITCTGELRDVLYTGKRSKTVGFNDNGDEPSSWPMTVIDTALGWPVHGIASVLDSGGTTVDYFIVATFAGVMIFNGRFLRPELTYPIQQLWKDQDRNLYRKIQVIIEPVNKKIYMTIPDGRLLEGDYANGLDVKNIRWTPWNFDVVLNAIAVVNIDTVILGADNPNPGIVV